MKKGVTVKISKFIVLAVILLFMAIIVKTIHPSSTSIAIVGQFSAAVRQSSSYSAGIIPSTASAFPSSLKW